VWDRLHKQIAVESERIRALLHMHEPPLEACSASEPYAIEVSALGTMLHGFCTGVESIFKRTEVGVGAVSCVCAGCRLITGGDPWAGHSPML